MKMKCTKKFLSFIFCVMLTAAMAFTAIGCSGRQDSENAVSEGEAKTYSDGDVLAFLSSNLMAGNTAFSNSNLWLDSPLF